MRRACSPQVRARSRVRPSRSRSIIPKCRALACTRKLSIVCWWPDSQVGKGGGSAPRAGVLSHRRHARCRSASARAAVAGQATRKKSGVPRRSGVHRASRARYCCASRWTSPVVDESLLASDREHNLKLRWAAPAPLQSGQARRVGRVADIVFRRRGPAWTAPGDWVSNGSSGRAHGASAWLVHKRPGSTVAKRHSYPLESVSPLRAGLAQARRGRAPLRDEGWQPATPR